jgi:hypothetical protein
VAAATCPNSSTGCTPVRIIDDGTCRLDSAGCALFVAPEPSLCAAPPVPCREEKERRVTCRSGGTGLVELGNAGPSREHRVRDELTLAASGGEDADVGQPTRDEVHVKQPFPGVEGVTPTAGAVVLGVGTPVEDFFTAGAGMVDDPASFALSFAAVLRGLQMLRGAAVVLRAVAVPGAVSLYFGVTAQTGSTGALH